MMEIIADVVTNSELSLKDRSGVLTVIKKIVPGPYHSYLKLQDDAIESNISELVKIEAKNNNEIVDMIKKEIIKLFPILGKGDDDDSKTRDFVLWLIDNTSSDERINNIVTKTIYTNSEIIKFIEQKRQNVNELKRISEENLQKISEDEKGIENITKTLLKSCVKKEDMIGKDALVKKAYSDIDYIGWGAVRNLIGTMGGSVYLGERTRIEENNTCIFKNEILLTTTIRKGVEHVNSLDRIPYGELKMITWYPQDKNQRGGRGTVLSKLVDSKEKVMGKLKQLLVEEKPKISVEEKPKISVEEKPPSPVKKPPSPVNKTPSPVKKPPLPVKKPPLPVKKTQSLADKDNDSRQQTPIISDHNGKTQSPDKKRQYLVDIDKKNGFKMGKTSILSKLHDFIDTSIKEYARFIIIPLTLWHLNDGEIHASIVMIDTETKRVEYYNPHIIKEYLPDKFEDIHDILFNPHDMPVWGPIMSKYEFKIISLEKNYKDVESIPNYPHASSWCMYIALLRVLYPDKEFAEIERELNQCDPHERIVNFTIFLCEIGNKTKLQDISDKKSILEIVSNVINDYELSLVDRPGVMSVIEEIPPNAQSGGKVGGIRKSDSRIKYRIKKYRF